MKLVRWSALLVILSAAPLLATAQAISAASRSPVQIGGGLSFGASDYGEDYIKGFSIYGDYTVTDRFSFEGDIHQQTIWTPDDIGEASYLVGPRYSFFLRDRANMYVKLMAGAGRFSVQPTHPNPYSDLHLATAFGAGIDFRAAPRINVRPLDVEYQWWPNFRPHGLTPWVATVGVAYMF